jgi:hypothetical protein
MVFNVIISVVVLRAVNPSCVLHWHSCHLRIMIHDFIYQYIINSLPHTFLSFQDSDNLHTGYAGYSLYTWQSKKLLSMFYVLICILNNIFLKIRCLHLCFGSQPFAISVLRFTTSCNISTYPFLVMHLSEDGNKIGTNMQHAYFVSIIK